uniref:glucose-6-phosphate 1-epimerase n=1 Tax=Aegilops tauschii subsp. strangulata TaxID=200361 RepID=A0A453KLZ3_AEGTS
FPVLVCIRFPAPFLQGLIPWWFLWFCRVRAGDSGWLPWRARGRRCTLPAWPSPRATAACPRSASNPRTGVRLRFICLEHASRLGRFPMERICSLSDQMLCSTARNPSGRPRDKLDKSYEFNSHLTISFSETSGGIPHCFPQFGPGPMQQHGFARNVNWSITDSEVTEGDPTVTLELKDDSYSRSMWDFSFQALYKVVLHSTSLSTTLKIINTDDKPFSFTSALHTYFSASIAGVSVKGLKGSKTLNKDPDPKNPLEGKEERDEVTFPGFVDCVYLGAPSELTLDNGLGDKIVISNTNWSDAVLWNPHLQMEACYKDFVCVENAKIETVQLGPKESWVAEQKIELI